MNERHDTFTLHPIIDRLLVMLHSHAQQLVVAGSVRRGKPTAKDVELVALSSPALLAHLDSMVIDRAIVQARYGDKQTTRWGDRYRGLVFEGVRFELFLGDTDNYGCVLLIRTGSGDCNEYLMTTLIQRKAPYRFIDGYFWYGTNWRKDKDKWLADNQRKVSVPDERTLYTLLGLPYIEPVQRNDLVAYRRGF